MFELFSKGKKYFLYKTLTNDNYNNLTLIYDAVQRETSFRHSLSRPINSKRSNGEGDKKGRKNEGESIKRPPSPPPIFFPGW